MMRMHLIPVNTTRKKSIPPLCKPVPHCVNGGGRLGGVEVTSNLPPDCFYRASLAPYKGGESRAFAS